MEYIKEFSFTGTIKYVPGSIHESPEEYSIIKYNESLFEELSKKTKDKFS